MGAAKRRKTAGAFSQQPKARVAIGEPGEHIHVPGTLTVHIVHAAGSTLTAAVQLENVDDAIAAGRRATKKLKGSLEDTREEARSWIAEMLLSNEHLQDQRTGLPQNWGCPGESALSNKAKSQESGHSRGGFHPREPPDPQFCGGPRGCRIRH